MMRLLAGKRVLVVEDHIIIAMDLAHELAAQEAKVIGPVGSLDGALKAIKDTDLDGVILDLNLGGRTASRSPMHWPTATSRSSSRPGTLMIFRPATRTCLASKNLPRRTSFVAPSRRRCRPP